MWNYAKFHTTVKPGCPVTAFFRGVRCAHREALEGENRPQVLFLEGTYRGLLTHDMPVLIFSYYFFTLPPIVLCHHCMEDQLATKIKQRILIVDDESDLRTLLGTVLTTAGYEIKSASDGDEAIKLISKQKFDLTILDINMPTVNGIQVLKYLKEHCPSTKAIMLTGYADLKHAMEAKEYGATDFIGKPYKVDDILTTIKRLLSE
jgi:CheY-like chemotaxis protein